MARSATISAGFSLKATLGLVVGALAALVMTACVIAGLDAWRGYVVALQVEEVNANTDTLLKGMESIQLERGQTNTALQAPAPASAQVREVIAKRRAEGDPQLSRGLERLAAANIPDGARLIADARRAYDRVKQLRQQADGALQMPREQRDAELLRAWYPALTDLIAKVQALWTAASREVSKQDAIVGQLTMIKQSAFIMREFAGRERATHAGNISASRPLSAEQQRDIATWRGLIQASWQTIRDLGTGTAPALEGAIAAADQGFIKTFGTQTEAVHKAGAAGAAYPMTVQQWYGASDPALATIVRIKDAAVEVTEAHADAAASAAKLRLVAVIALTLLGIAISIVSIVIAARRIARPLTAMTASMRRLAEGDKSIDIPALQRRDEVGEMARSVGVFRDNALKADALAAEQEAERGKKERRQQAMETLTRDFDTQATGVLDNVAQSIAAMRSTASSHDVHHRSRQHEQGPGRGHGRERDLGQRADRGRRHRGAFGLGGRDRPAGDPVGQHRGQSGAGGGADQCRDPGPGGDGPEDRRHRQADQ
jgi:HAMP domain-containing protein